MNGWHLKKEVTIGHIFTSLTVTGSVLLWVFSLSSRVEVIATEVNHIKGDMVKIEHRTSENLSEIKGSLIRIEEKIDRKADK